MNDRSLRSRVMRTVFCTLGSMLLVCLFVACEETHDLEDIRKMHSRGEFAASVAPLAGLVAASPDDPELNLLYGRALRRSGSPDRALWSLRKAADSERWWLLASMELASAALANQDWANAIVATSRVLDDDPEHINALLMRAQARMGAKSEPELALDDLDLVLEIDPDQVLAQSNRVAALIALQRVDEAGEALATLEEVAEETEVDYGVRGGICVARAHFESESARLEEAEKLFAACLERYPDHPTVLDEAVSFYDSQKRSDKGNEALVEALALSPDSSVLRIRLSRRYLAAKKFAESEAVLRSGLEHEDPIVVSDCWQALADHYVALDDMPAAAEAYEKSLEIIETPSDFEWFTLADVLARAGQFDRALEVASRVKNDAYRGLVEARVHLDRGEPAKALTRLDEVLPLWPNNPGARYYAARAAEQVGQFDRAIEEYRQAIRSNPIFTEAGLRLARIHEAEGASEPAWAAIREYAEVNPDDREAVALQIRLASQYGPENRLAGLAQILRETPTWPTAVAARADFIGDLGDEKAALSVLELAEGLDFSDPRDVDALASLVRHLSALGRYVQAQRFVDAAKAKAPRFSEFRRVQGDLLVAADKPGPAIIAYESALELDPKNVRALVALGRERSRAGDIEAALELFDRAIELRVDDPAAHVESARLMSEADRLPEAEARWEALLRQRPEHVEAALALVRLRIDRAAPADRTRELLDRAERFRAGEPVVTLRAELGKSG